ncbi:MAG: YerC/YecD family TrpR-related protein [Erysipelotrichaceae bacterium]|nr:YerC/YecD family TrpR-related protein [Erysipelotrichaceae bacterium]
MKNNLDSFEINQLFQAILSLETEEECRKFFKDICTVNELKTFAQRFDVGIRLLNGKTYQEVSKETGASTATISRVRRLLGDDEDGLEMAAARLKEKENQK